MHVGALSRICYKKFTVYVTSRHLTETVVNLRNRLYVRGQGMHVNSPVPLAQTPLMHTPLSHQLAHTPHPLPAPSSSSMDKTKFVSLKDVSLPAGNGE